YGPPPEAVEWLLRTTEIRLLCVRWQIASVHRDGPDLVFTYRSAERAERLAALSGGRGEVGGEKALYLRLRAPDRPTPAGLYRLLLAVLNPSESAPRAPASAAAQPTT